MDTQLTKPARGCRVKLMYNHVNQKNGEPAPLVSEELYNIVMAVRDGDCGPACQAKSMLWPPTMLVPVCKLSAEQCSACLAVPCRSLVKQHI